MLLRCLSPTALHAVILRCFADAAPHDADAAAADAAPYAITLSLLMPPYIRFFHAAMPRLPRQDA